MPVFHPFANLSVARVGANSPRRDFARQDGSRPGVAISKTSLRPDCLLDEEGLPLAAIWEL